MPQLVRKRGQRFSAARESLLCGTKVLSQDVRFADPLIGEEAIDGGADAMVALN